MMNINDFAYNITRLRKDACMSQSELAQKMNVSISAVSKWENGKNLPGIETMEAIAELFQVPIDSLINPYTDSVQDDLADTPTSLSPNAISIEETATTKASDTYVCKKPFGFFARTITFSSIVLIFCVAGFLVTTKLNASSDKCRVMKSRTVTDEYWGTVTELAVYCNGSYDNQAVVKYSSVIREEWIQENKYGGQDVDSIKVYYYNNKSSARKFDNNYQSYLYLIPIP